MVVLNSCIPISFDSGYEVSKTYVRRVQELLLCEIIIKEISYHCPMNIYLFDTSAYSEVDLNLVPEKIAIYGMAQSQVELLNTGNKELRCDLIRKYEKAHDAEVPKSFYIPYYPKEENSSFMKSEKQLSAESFIVGTPNVGCAKVGGTGIYHKIMDIMNSERPHKNHKIDCLIGEVAIVKKLILVSKDSLLREAVNKLGGNAISPDDFMKQVGARS